MDAPQSKHHRLHPAWTVCFACCLMMFIAIAGISLIHIINKKEKEQ